MGLNDFDKLGVNNSEEVDDDKLIEDIDFEDFAYYIQNIDELIDLVRKSYVEYINIKLKYEFKKSKLQTTINWNEENALRVNNGLPKCTNQDQKNASIDLKLKSLSVEKHNLEVKYKFYKQVFTFISNNYDLLQERYNVLKNSEN